MKRRLLMGRVFSQSAIQRGIRTPNSQFLSACYPGEIASLYEASSHLFSLFLPRCPLPKADLTDGLYQKVGPMPPRYFNDFGYKDGKRFFLPRGQGPFTGTIHGTKPGIILSWIITLQIYLMTWPKLLLLLSSALVRAHKARSERRKRR